MRTNNLRTLLAMLLAGALLAGALAVRADDVIKTVYHLPDDRLATLAMNNISNHLAADPGVRIVVVANKCDGPKWESHAVEAANLGFGDALPLSAKSNYFRRDFLDALYDIAKALPGVKPGARDPDAAPEMKVAIVGKRNAGKSSLVNALAGEASFSTKGGSFVPLYMGTKLHQGDKVRTGAGSHVDIDLGGNVGIVQVAPQSLFTLDKITITDAGEEKLTETQLRIDEGAIYAKINKLAKGSRYEIATPKGIAGIRGTAVYATADGQITVLEGLAGVAYPNAAGGVDTALVHDGETVGPNDRPPHAAPSDLQRDIVEALRDAVTHGVGLDFPPFVPPLEPFISPTLPLGKRATDGQDFPTETR